MSDLSNVVLTPRLRVIDIEPFRRAARPYFVALAFVAAALGATLVLQQVYDGRPSLFPFFAAIAAAAWLGGSGPGFLAVAVSAPLGLHFYADAAPSPNLLGSDIALFVFFASCAFAGGALNSRRRQAEDVLRTAHRQLQGKAAELEIANAALLAEIGERRRTQAALEETRAELARVARLTAMGELAASIAHEINQPLTAVVTNAETCVRWLEAPEPELTEARDAARRVVRDANRVGQVVGRVRAMVRKALSERTRIDVSGTIEDVLALLQPDIARQRVCLRTDVPFDLPPIWGDRIQLQQVLVNLITNALESLSRVDTRPRELVISARLDAAKALAIKVEDNGDGFAPGVRDRLFEAFVTTKPNGMGIGLSICRTIVEAHGGTLAAAPAATHGAVFTVTLPAGGALP